ncbi:MAG TPA: DUF748 domain-containing protein [Puia sp.]|nr:DUF748 domain-containing protein [Puia sp.]
MVHRSKISAFVKARKTLLIILGSLLLILIAARIALPYVLLKLVNQELQKIPGYTGHVDDIDVALWRGAYKIKMIRLDKTGGKVPVPFFSSPLVDLSIEWRALFHGRIVGEIEVEHPGLNFVKGPTEETSQTKVSKKWTDVVDKLMPLKLNRFEINDGEIHYRDFYSHPKFDIYTKEVHILAENLSNAYKTKEELPGKVDATAKVYGGSAYVKMKINPLNDQPTFDAKAELKNLDITQVNDFIEAFAKFDVKSGNLSIYTEAAAKQGLITGYTKPIIRDLKVVNWERDKDNPLKLAWEGVVGGVAWVFKNHDKDQLATKAEFEGRIKDPNVDIWYIIGQVLRNAFIQALYPSLENSININLVGKGEDAPDSDMKKAYEKSKQDIHVKEEKKPESKKEKRAERKAERKKKREEKKKAREETKEDKK